MFLGNLLEVNRKQVDVVDGCDGVFDGCCWERVDRETQYHVGNDVVASWFVMKHVVVVFKYKAPLADTFRAEVVKQRLWWLL